MFAVVTGTAPVVRTSRIDATIEEPRARIDSTVRIGLGPSPQNQDLDYWYKKDAGDPPPQLVVPFAGEANVHQKLTCGYGHRLSPAEGGPSPTDLLSLTPVVHRPHFTHTETVPFDTVAAVDRWFASHGPPSHQAAFLRFDPHLFSTMAGTDPLRLVRFRQLDYQLTTE